MNALDELKILNETERLKMVLRDKDRQIDVLKVRSNALSLCLFLALVILIIEWWPL